MSENLLILLFDPNVSIKMKTRMVCTLEEPGERGVALMDEYNKLLTNNEEQKQFLLLIVKEYRRRYLDRSKKNTDMLNGYDNFT